MVSKKKQPRRTDLNVVWRDLDSEREDKVRSVNQKLGRKINRRPQTKSRDSNRLRSGETGVGIGTRKPGRCRKCASYDKTGRKGFDHDARNCPWHQ